MGMRARAGTPHADICAREVANLSSDLVDAKVLAVLVYQVARRPEGAPPAIVVVWDTQLLLEHKAHIHIHTSNNSTQRKHNT